MPVVPPFQAQFFTNMTTQSMNQGWVAFFNQLASATGLFSADKIDLNAETMTFTEDNQTQTPEKSLVRIQTTGASRNNCSLGAIDVTNGQVCLIYSVSHLYVELLNTTINFAGDETSLKMGTNPGYVRAIILVMDGTTGYWKELSRTLSETIWPEEVVMGDLFYASADNEIARLPKSPLSNQYLSNTGAGYAPKWTKVEAADVGISLDALSNVTLTNTSSGGEPGGWNILIYDNSANEWVNTYVSGAGLSYGIPPGSGLPGNRYYLTIASYTAPYIVYTASGAGPVANVLTAGTGINIVNTGGGGTTTVSIAYDTISYTYFGGL